MLTSEYATTAAQGVLAVVAVAATLGVIGLAAFNAKIRQWLEETSPREEWIYEQRGRFRFYLLWAGVVATIVPLSVIVTARPLEIFWFQVIKGPPLSFGWSFLIVVTLMGGTIAAAVRLVWLAMQTGAALASEIRAQQVTGSPEQGGAPLTTGLAGGPLGAGGFAGTWAGSADQLIPGPLGAGSGQTEDPFPYVGASPEPVSEEDGEE